MRWPTLGRATLEPIAVQPGPGDLVVEVTASIVSSGTERAWLLGLPNARVDFPFRPGYAASGRVVWTGRSAGGLAPGDEVALLDVPHQSIVAVPPRRAYRVPANVPLADAAILQLALIAGLGIHKAGLRPREPFGVIGAGLIGALVQRLGQAWGAGPCVAIAKTSAKQPIARAGGVAAFLTAERDLAAIERLGLPVVVEATGDPRALSLALRAVGPGSRIVVLGSPRGQAPFEFLETVRRKRLRLVGAHIAGISGARGPGSPHLDDLTRRILETLAAGKIELGDLLEPADPKETAHVYRRLVKDRRIVGVRFDWTRLTAASTGGTRQRRRSAPPPRGRKPTGEAAPFGLGFVGCGEIAVVNADAVAMTPNVSITAVYDVDPRLSRELADRHGAVATPELGTLLERDDVDAVVLALPHHLHAPVALEAAQAGKHVVVEKPAAVDLRSAVQMVRAVERAGVALSVCFPQRYSAEVELGRRIFERNGLGELFMIEVLWYADKPLSYLYGGFSGRSPSTWRMRRETSGGGTLLMNLCHALDLVHHVTGLSVGDIAGDVANVEQIGDVEDTFAFNVHYERGVLGVVAGSAAARDLRYESVRLLGTDGRLDLRPVGEVFTHRTVDDLGITADTRVPLGQVSAPLVSRSRYFGELAAAIRAGRPPPVTGHDGLKVQAVIEAAYEAAATGVGVRPADLLRAAEAQADYAAGPPVAGERGYEHRPSMPGSKLDPKIGGISASHATATP